MIATKECDFVREQQLQRNEQSDQLEPESATVHVVAKEEQMVCRRAQMQKFGVDSGDGEVPSK